MTENPTRVRPLLVITGRHPYEVAILSSVLAAGLALLVSDTRPASVAAAMPGAVQACWEVGLIFAGIVGLAGVFWPGRLSSGLGVELVAVAALGTVTTMYALVLFAVSGVSALAAGAFIVAVAAGSWCRAAQIGRDLVRLARATAAGVTADVTVLVEGPDR